jgi:hypothetical protein
MFSVVEKKTFLCPCRLGDTIFCISLSSFFTFVFKTIRFLFFDNPLIYCVIFFYNNFF